jgi:hypothetical protein
MPGREILVKKNVEELSAHAARLFTMIAEDAINSHGNFSVALSGGSTPRKLYSLLSTEFKAAIDWTRVDFFFGDERNVRPNADDSNYRMANETLLRPLQIDPAKIFRWRTELDDPKKVGAMTCYEVNIFDTRPEQEYGTGAIVNVAKVNPMPKAGGKWNVMEIEAKGPVMSITFNGQKTVNGARDAKHPRGPFALQYGAGVVKFRKVEIRPL